MCDVCVEIDKKIEHYRRLARQVADQPTRDGIERLIAQCYATKIGLHATLPEKAWVQRVPTPGCSVRTR